MQLLLLVLQLVKPVVNTALGEKLLARALFAQAPFVEDEDAVGVLDGAQAMGDDQSGAPGEQAAESFANEKFRFRVHAGGGFVKDEETRIVGQGAGEIDELALADRKSGAALVDVAGHAFGQGANELAEADFFNGVFDGIAVDAGCAEADIRFDGAGEKKGILKDDAELAAQILELDEANVFAIKEDLTALDVVEAQQQGDQGGLAGAGVADDGESLAGLDAEGNISEDPVLIGGLWDISIAEPDVAEFDFATRMIEGNGVGIGFDDYRLVEELENALGGGHRGLKNVEFFAEILNGTEKALGEHSEGGEDAESDAAGKNAVSARPIDQSDGGEAEKLDGGVEEGVSENGVAPGEHIVAIALAKFVHGFLFAVKELHDAHAGNVFLEEGVDAGDGGSNAAIGIANELAENHGDDEDAGEDGKDHEEEEVVDHGDDAGGEEIVESVDVGGDAGNQAADGIAVEIAHRQALHVDENFAPHVIHGLLADALHDANLDVLGEEVEGQDGKKDQAEPANAGPCGGFGEQMIQGRNEIVVDGISKDERRGQFERGDDGHHDEREHHAPFVRLPVLQKPAHQARIVRFAEGFFFVHIAHARSSSSSSNCF